jgi:hypothetical protein
VVQTLLHRGKDTAMSNDPGGIRIIDFTHDHGALRPMREADVVTRGLGPGAGGRPGHEHEAVTVLNPRAIPARITDLDSPLVAGHTRDALAELAVLTPADAQRVCERSAVP